MNDHRSGMPIVGITIGDAAGIGPEITRRAVAGGVLRQVCRPLIIADEAHVRKLAGELGIEVGRNLAELYDIVNLPTEIVIGVAAADTGRAAAENIEAA